MPHILAVHASPTHSFSKSPQSHIHLLAGLGIAGDAHLGTTVQHRSRIAQDPTQPNLRQVLIACELFTELAPQGFAVTPGELGENITTSGLDLLTLPRGTLLHLGPEALIEMTGLRNPCAQIDAFQPGLLAAVLPRTPDGILLRRAGVMSVVLHSGTVRPGDPIRITLPPLPHLPLERV